LEKKKKKKKRKEDAVVFQPVAFIAIPLVQLGVGVFHHPTAGRSATAEENPSQSIRYNKHIMLYKAVKPTTSSMRTPSQPYTTKTGY
jgi:hypothetical protein